MALHQLLNGVRVLAVVCNQWGDTGKGKFTDYFASQWAHVIVRGTGGNNAGHTVVVDGKERITHLLPAGIAHDSEGKINVLGNGMVIDLRVLGEELQALEREGMSYNNLMISKDANVIMPYHIKRDENSYQSQRSGGVGSTGKGVGPCYGDKVVRRGIKIADLYSKDILVKKITEAVEFYPEQEVDVGSIIDEMQPYSNKIAPFVRDTVTEMHNFVRQGKNVLLEGAQGLLLSIEHGTYPYVTSSDCSLNGTATGAGLPASAVDLSLGIVKFPFMTRVGGGPFPTELGSQNSEVYCSEANHRNEDELQTYGISYTLEDGKVRYDQQDQKIIEMMNSPDPFLKGVGIRLAAREYGTTTRRPRRIGWTDAVAAKYAVGINGSTLILTKADAIAGMDAFNICYGYSNGTGSRVGTEFQRDPHFLRTVHPEYTQYTGYGDISSARRYKELPETLQKAVSDFEQFTGGNVAVISVGPDRDETIVVEKS